MPDLVELRETFRARPEDGKVSLAGYSTDRTPFVDDKSDAKDDLDDSLPDRLFDAHELLFANERRMLLILQGLDASGKNGTIKHVVIHLNPAGVHVASFKEPDEEEEEHHFLWRYRQQLPQPGRLSVFDRSYYEDVLVPIALGDLDEDEIDERIDEINEFEQELIDDGVVVLKCLLHISFDEQRRRFLRRLRRDDKRWKFSEGDLETRRRWNEFMASYSVVVGRTTTDIAPWYVIPADNKWYRNWAIANLVVETLDSLGLDYPQPVLDIEDLRERLAPPN